MASSLTAIALPPEARTARRIRKIPDRSRDAYARGNRAADPRLGAFWPRSKARTIGAQPAACTAYHTRDASVPIQPRRSQLLERLPHADQSRCRRPSGRRSTSGNSPVRAARRARAPSSSCPRCDRAPSSVEQVEPARLTLRLPRPACRNRRSARRRGNTSRPAARSRATFTVGVSSGQKT